jgi:S1-C subfamily serine protease
MQLRKLSTAFLGMALCLLVLAGRSAAADEAQYVGLHRPLTSTSVVLAAAGRGLVAQGTAWVVDRENKLIVTNRHVVGDGAKVQAIFPVYQNGQARADRAFYLKQGTRFKGTVLDRDAKRDLAVIQLDQLPADAPELKLATETPKPGDRVHMSGNPGSSKTCFVFASGKVREVSEIKMIYQNAQKVAARVSDITTDVKLGPGVSGGPVVNEKGELVAVMAAGPRDGGRVVLCIDVAEVRPFLGDALRKLGTAAIGKSEYGKAVAYCTKAIAFNPDDPLSFNERGVARSYQGDYDEAIADYTAAVKLDKKLARAYRNRGSAHYHKGKYDKSVADCTEAIVIDPKYALAYIWRSRALTKMGKAAEAQADHDKAVALDPRLKK